MRWALKDLVPSGLSFQETIQSHGGTCAPVRLAEKRIAPMTPTKRATSKSLVLRASPVTTLQSINAFMSIPLSAIWALLHRVVIRVQARLCEIRATILIEHD